MLTFYIILFILLIGFIVFLVNKFKNDKKYGIKHYDFKDGNFIVYSLILLVISYFLVASVFKEPSFDNYDEMIAYGERTSQPWLKLEAYKQLSRQDTMNADYHQEYVSAYFDPKQYLCPDYRSYNKESKFLFEYYAVLSNSAKTAYADIGHNFLVSYYLSRSDFNNARLHLNKIQDTTLKYYHVFKSRVMYYYRDTKGAYSAIKNEIVKKGAIGKANEYLSLFYDAEGEMDSLRNLVYDANAKNHVPLHLKDKIYVLDLDFGNYFKELWRNLTETVNLPGFIGAFLILVTWLFFLMKVNINRTTGVFSVVFVLLLSIIFMIPAWMFYDIFKYFFDFTLNGEIWNDLLYCIFGIGLIEEIVKIIPFLIILWCTKLIRTPVDYIIYASICALGFAFIENFRYFENSGLHIIHSRALTASIAHMIFTSTIAYGLVLAKFKHKKSQFLYFLIFFSIAIFSHGFYDFWLLNEIVSEYYLVTFLFLVMSILVYASFLNNALNHSVLPNSDIKLRTARLASNLSGALIMIFIFEFISVSLVYGPTIGERELVNSVIGGGYMLLFVSVRLSNLDIFPGEWFPVEFFVGLLPLQVISGGRKPDFNSLTGKKIAIESFRKGSKLDAILPIEGIIISRKKIEGFTGWFLVKINKTLSTKAEKEHILIKAKDQGELMDEYSKTVIAFSLIPISDAGKEDKKSKDYSFVDWATAKVIN